MVQLSGSRARCSGWMNYFTTVWWMFLVSHRAAGVAGQGLGSSVSPHLTQALAHTG